MRKKCSKFITVLLPMPILLLTVSTIFSLDGNAQTLTVKGIVSASSVNVRYASVTFTNTSDTSNKISVLTDTSGYYSFTFNFPTDVQGVERQPSEFALAQNYPNPFTASTAISFQLNKQSEVKVTIYDILGREIKKFAMGVQEIGPHGIVWNGKDALGTTVAKGIYFYRLQSGNTSQVKKMVFGLGAGNVVIPVPNIISSRIVETGKSANINIAGGTYTVAIGYTDSTYPLIAPRQFIRVRVLGDTTLNYSIPLLSPVAVDPGSTQQIIRGFGGANLFIFGIRDMTPAEVQTAFGNGDGQIGLSIMRVAIPPDSTQFSAYIPSAKLAESLGAKVFATPWTPPTWMKTNNNIAGGSLDTSKYGAYAAYLKSFADKMANNGAPLYAVSVQNEPDWNATYQSCLWNGNQFLNFMKNNAPAVGTPVLMPESLGFNHSLSDPTLNDSVAASHVAFIGGHIYGVAPSSYPLALSKGKELWMTEYLINSGSSTNLNSIDTGWTGALQTAQSINDCMTANMSAYVWWYIVRYYGPIDDGTKGGVAGTITKKGYVMSQFAKFVRPGYYRVAATATPQLNVSVTAYTGASKTVIVVLNMNSYSAIQPFSLTSGTAASFTPYVTSSTKNCVLQNNVSYINGSFTYTLDPFSVTTFVSN